MKNPWFIVCWWSEPFEYIYAPFFLLHFLLFLPLNPAFTHVRSNVTFLLHARGRLKWRFFSVCHALSVQFYIDRSNDPNVNCCKKRILGSTSFATKASISMCALRTETDEIGRGWNVKEIMLIYCFKTSLLLAIWCSNVVAWRLFAYLFSSDGIHKIWKWILSFCEGK